MKRLLWTYLSVAAAMLVALQANAAVQVTPNPESEPQKETQPPKAAGAEKPVAFQVGARFLTANSGGVIDLTGSKIGSKQSFTLIDLNGGELADGDEVRIQYIPGKAGNPDPTKSTYWAETPEGVRRNRQGEAFKLKQTGTKYMFQTAKGKFLGQPFEGALTLVDKEPEALVVEIIDLSHGVPKIPKAPKPETSETAAPAPAEKSSAE